LLAQMTPEQLVDAVVAWKPSSAFGAPEPRGLSRSISHVVSHKATVYAADAKVLKRLDATYLYGVLDGFRTAVRAGRSFDWPSVLDLCVWVTSQPRKIGNRKESARGLHSHWGEARKAVLWLIS